MKYWPWHRGVAHKEDTGHREAKEAFAKAMEARQKAERLAAEVEPVMERIRERRKVNGFTELFEEAFRGGTRDDR